MASLVFEASAVIEVSGLKEYTKHREKSRNRERKAVYHHQKKMKRKYFEVLLRYLAQRQHIKEQVEMKVKERHDILFRWVFVIWKKYVIIQQKIKKNMFKSCGHHENAIKRKYFFALQIYCKERIKKKFYEEEAVVRAQVKLEKGYLKIFWGKWRLAAIEGKLMEHKNERAATYQRRTLCCKYMEYWKMYIHITRRKNTLRKACYMYRTRCLEKTLFHRWRLQFEARLKDQQQCNLSVWWWSHQLQVKVFKAWHSYSNSHKEKKIEYINALNFRRNYLLQKGVTQWIQYAAFAIETRQKIVHEEQVKRSLELQKRVHRYALHWLKKTKSSTRRKFNTETCTFGKSKLNWNEELSMSVARIPKSETTNRRSDKLSIEERYKSFNTVIPAIKKRAPPRLPDYLRESYDLTNLRTVKSPIKNYGPVFEQSESDDIPRSSAFLPVNYSAIKSSDTSLELTPDVDIENTVRKSQLLPPSSFMKKIVT